MTDFNTAPVAARPDNQIVGNIGMYYVCYQLSRLGWNVMPTARNAKGVDITAYSPDGKRLMGLKCAANCIYAPPPRQDNGD
jgi:hypothetical protein